MAHDHAHESGDAHRGGHHITPIPVLFHTFVLLLILMSATIAAAVLPYQIAALAWMQPLSPLTNSIAIGIACWKAWAVIQVFMGVKFSTNLTKLFAYGGFVWLIFLGIMLVDYATRSWEPVRGWEDVPSSALPRNRAIAE